MRISADSKSADWHPVAIHAKALLDGVEQSGCLMADEERGQVINIARGDDGKILVNPDSGEFLVVCKHGKVVVEVLEQYRHLLAEYPFGPADWVDAEAGEQAAARPETHIPVNAY
jgi:hypothetical protein